MPTKTPAKHLEAMMDSVNLINGIVNGTKMVNADAEEKQDTVDRNVEHLVHMKLKDFWTDENFTGVNIAITAGNNYTA